MNSGNDKQIDKRRTSPHKRCRIIIFISGVRDVLREMTNRVEKHQFPNPSNM